MLQSKLVESALLHDAARYSRAITEFRTLYTAKVVEVVRQHGIEVTHDVEGKENAIPLPATLSIELGNRITEKESGSHVRLYSLYPFPWRSETGGLRDDFARDAWIFFQVSPDTSFFRFEEIDGRPSLRFATADLMRPSCVNCHNTHPESPKTDWKVRDVRGVLEVAIPIDTFIAQRRSGIRRTFFLIGGMTLLGLATLVMVKSRLRREEKQAGALKLKNLRMSAELDVAKDIQRSMLPLIFPAFPEKKEIDVYALLEPAREVGGDFYDFYIINEDYLFFNIGDVSDKGVPAALFMAITNTLLKARSSGDYSPSSILTHVNELICKDNKSSMFITLFYGVLNIRTGEIIFSNAGHNPPYIKRIDGSVETLNQKHGPAVGVIGEVSYKEDSIRLKDGEFLVMFTDGVTEAMDSDRKLYSNDRLLNLIKDNKFMNAEDAVNIIFGNVKEHVGNYEQVDDIAVVVLHYLGNQGAV
ncbi:MAG: SpoIIE family protein phosphatase [Candidatus Dadabacteria bacterium]|nr:SpoIIE family protein phosphatase [Candidatus Dadabacteria bacterium]